jgi:hypothetical protein
VGGGDLVGPGPGGVDAEQLASCAAHEASGDGQDAQPQSFGFVAGGRAGEGQSLGEDQQVGG